MRRPRSICRAAPRTGNHEVQKHLLQHHHPKHGADQGAVQGLLGNHPGNSDTLLYLGGNESSTHKYISEALGKSTIDTKTHGETKGKSGSWSTNMQISGRELLTPDEVRRLDNRYAILLIRGAGPVMDLKYDLMKHPAVRQTSLAGGPPYIHHRQNQAPVISGHEFFAAFSTDDANENKENAA